MVERAKEYGYKNVRLILDRGYFSIKNIQYFDAKGYDNNTKVFRGISEGRVTVKQDSELPSGTYFYILKYTDAEGNSKEKSSYLYINR